MTNNESILNKQVRYLKEPFPGLCHYMIKDPSEVMLNCPKDMDVFIGLQLNSKWNCCKYLPSSPESLIKVLLIGILEESFNKSTESHHLLKRVKEYAYDQSLQLATRPLDEVPQQFRNSYNEKGLRKMLVELFHLISASPLENKVVQYLAKHPFVMCILQTLFVNILKTKIQQNQVTFDQVVQKLSEALGFRIKKIKSGIFQIGADTFIGQDSKAIYKICSSEPLKNDQDYDDSSLNTSNDSRRSTLLGDELQMTRIEYNNTVDQIPQSEPRSNRIVGSYEKSMSFTSPTEGKWSSTTEATNHTTEYQSVPYNPLWKFQNMHKQQNKMTFFPKSTYVIESPQKNTQLRTNSRQKPKNSHPYSIKPINVISSPKNQSSSYKQLPPKTPPTEIGRTQTNYVLSYPSNPEASNKQFNRSFEFKKQLKKNIPSDLAKSMPQYQFKKIISNQQMMKDLRGSQQKLQQYDNGMASISRPRPPLDFRREQEATPQTNPNNPMGLYYTVYRQQPMSPPNSYTPLFARNHYHSSSTLTNPIRVSNPVSSKPIFDNRVYFASNPSIADASNSRLTSSQTNGLSFNRWDW